MHTNHYERNRHRGHYGKVRAAYTVSHHSRQAGDTNQALPFWPALLSLEQIGAYTGMHPDTFLQHAPVSPVRLGARLLRWRRADIDRWLESLQTRGVSMPSQTEGLPSTTALALQRVLERSNRRKAD